MLNIFLYLWLIASKCSNSHSGLCTKTHYNESLERISSKHVQKENTGVQKKGSHDMRLDAVDAC